MGRLWLLMIVGIGLAQCFKLRKKVEDPMPKSKLAGEPREIDVPVGGEAPNGTASAGSAPIATSNQPSVAPSPQVKCDAYGKLPAAPPVGVGKPHFVVTRVLKLCQTADGKDGYEPDTPYLAMGFPCSGGGGEVNIKGNAYEPKMVSFRLGIGCSMAPKESTAISAILKKEFGVFQDAKLLAYTPFEIQYWELILFPETADVGSVVELRSGEALKKGWESFQKREPIKVRLIGRESAWIKGGQYYQVEGAIISESPKRFRLDVDTVKPLDNAEYQAVKQRCLALQPRRDCGEAFLD
jgi:hypothetical protein